ncbi:MAG: bifunctional phosphopantothenoylcysteine decarboxylase/phosphopantothenate--cysteine ligase CoaBC, partial [Polyangiaceae bacterium]|nr:bifunctional phosphopantothenoylcysteine decarboxylase/phosphopantothenate--cysteine ligase CoaBC [Polyangiaceae bacterium]
VAEARRKLLAKQIDIIVANHASDSFGKDDNRATIITGDSEDGVLALGVLPKTALADRILHRALAVLRR